MTRELWRIEEITVASKLDFTKEPATRHRSASVAGALYFEPSLALPCAKFARDAAESCTLIVMLAPHHVLFK
jgi:hypothetical protein